MLYFEKMPAMPTMSAVPTNNIPPWAHNKRKSEGTIYDINNAYHLTTED